MRFIVFTIVVVVCQNQDITSADDTAEYAKVTKEKEQSTPETSAPGFGLAWLYPGTKYTPPPKGQELQTDPRIEGTWLTLSASREFTNQEINRIESKSKGFTLTSESDDNSTACDPEDQLRKLDTMEDDVLLMQCKLHDVHHQVDLDGLAIEWIRHVRTEEHGEDGTKVECVESILKTEAPECKLFTDFPFVDLQTSSKSISCTSELVVSSLVVNNTGEYECRGRVGFTGGPRESYTLSAGYLLRVERKNDYTIHKIISLAIIVFIILLLTAMTMKKMFGRKMAWEFRPDGYPQAWSTSMMSNARRIASAGSLYRSSSFFGRRRSMPGEGISLDGGIAIDFEVDREKDDVEYHSTEDEAVPKIEVATNEEGIPLKSALKKTSEINPPDPSQLNVKKEDS